MIGARTAVLRGALIAGLWFAPTCAKAQFAVPVLQTASDPVDFSGLWVISNRSQNGMLDENLQPMLPEDYLTDAGLAATREVRPALDPGVLCLPAMPRHLSGPYPIEIVQRPGRMVMLFEWDTVFRIVYTDGRGHPDVLDDTRFMGHATGQWQGDTLVVETANFNGKTWLQGNGIPISTEARLSERYQLQDSGQTLIVDVQFEDPVNLSRPIHRRHVYNRRNDWAIREYMCAEANRDNIFNGQEDGLGSLEADDVLPEN